MDTTNQPKGNFTINLNFRRKGNPDAPPITGRISTPENPEVAFNFSAFRHDGDKGAYWIGTVDTNRTVRQALHTSDERGHNVIAIRENGFKVFKELADGSQNPEYQVLSREDQAKEDAKPAFWASWTRTATDPVLLASAWEREPNRYGPWASGSTQHKLTKEQLAAVMQAAEPAADRAEATVALATDIVDHKARSRGGRGE